MNDVREHVRCSPSNFKRNVTDDHAFQANIAELGIELITQGNKEREFRKVLNRLSIHDGTRDSTKCLKGLESYLRPHTAKGQLL